jgi:type 1 glutamine amidotransferase
MRSALALLLAAPMVAPAQLPDPEKFFVPGKLRVLLLSGRNNHDWQSTTPFIRRILETSGRFDVRVNEEPAMLTAAGLEPFDVIVSDYNGPRWGLDAELAFDEFVKNGKGLVVLHAASYAFGSREVLAPRQQRTGLREPPWEAYGKMVGALWTEEPRTGHGRRHSFEVKWADPAHPIAAGAAPFQISDELYHHFKMLPGVNVIARALDATEIGGTGKDEPLLWTVQYGKGRVFHSALGHDTGAMQAAGYVASLARGTEWAATGKVSLPAAISMHPVNKDAVRVLAVTGGHDHEASFYSVLEDRPELRVNVDPHPLAFRGDLRKRYDVLVLYDMVQDIPDAQKKNLQEFVEAGKGLVALHHSIASFQNWPWFSKEVLGGRYVLNASDGLPASSYKHDVEMTVKPVGTHPILRGIPELRLIDETYKNMWISPQATVLLRTDEATSDGPVAWVSPCEKSRVVMIQLGHGREAHVHPHYRQLVRNAILWAAGRN